MSEEFDVKETKRYGNAVASRDWQTCDFMYEEFEFLSEKVIKLQARLEEAEEVIDRLNSEAVGKEYGLDSEDIWEISREYLAKYQEEK
jgi:hypothetical protein